MNLLSPSGRSKSMIRMIVMSKAFRQSSEPSEAGLAKDASATLLWRFPPRRVEAEVIRDSVLQASGHLDDSIGGPSYRIHNVKKALRTVGSLGQSQRRNVATDALPGTNATC